MNGSGAGVGPCPDGRFVASLIQLCSGRAVSDNLEICDCLVRRAAAAGANYIQTPEVTNFMVTRRQDLFSRMVPEDDDTALTHFRRLAKELEIWLHLGSLVVRVGEEQAANRSFLIGPGGEIVARYDKIHMFDVDLESGESYRESANYRAGNRLSLARLPWAGLGLTICYDLRFPALYGELAARGADLIAVPSAFTRQTGEAHWRVLLRARAIETGSFVLAAAQSGRHACGRETYGHSLIVDPWGKVLAEASEAGPCIVSTEIDIGEVRRARQRIPALQNRRSFVFPNK